MALRPPFRADQVGSRLRLEALKQAREQFLGPQTPTSSLGPHDDARLKEVEDRCIRECIAMQECIGRCGFASSIKGNPLTQADQETKLTRIVETAAKVWGSR